MLKIADCGLPFPCPIRSQAGVHKLTKIMWVMKLTFFLLTVAFVHTYAIGSAQNVTISGKALTFKEIFATIKKQTGYVVLMNKDLISDRQTIALTATDLPLKNFLDLMLNNQPLKYDIEDKTIFISRKAPAVLSEQPLAVIRIQVVDSTGIPLPGASVRNKKMSGVTDAQGMVSLSVNEHDVLVISFIGHETRTIQITAAVINAGALTVTLRQSASQLSGVEISTGFQQITREKMTGATVTVGSDELEKRYTPNILNNLEGRIPGLVNFRGNTEIRGISTINASKNALVVLDGLPIEGTIADVNPYDVETITVLKDAAAAAIYGVRAANGVIVITTKKARGKRTSVEVSSDVTVTDKPDIDYNLLSPAQQVDLESQVYQYVFANSGGLYANTAAAVTATTNSLSNGSAMSPVYYAYYQFAKGDISQSQLDAQLAGFRQNNFRKQFKDNAMLKDVLQQYNFAIRSDGAKYQSSLVLNYKNDNTGIINAYNRQLNIFYKGAYQPVSWLDINYGINTVLGYAKASNSNFATSATDVPSYQPLLDAQGQKVYYTTADYNNYNTNTATQPTQSLLVNHLEELGKDFKYSNQQNSRYFANLNFKVLPGLTLKPQFQYENNNLSTSAYSEADSYIMRYLKSVYTTLLPANGGKLATTSTKGDYWTARGQAEYQHGFGKHAIDVIAGTEFRQTRVKGVAGLLLGYDDQLQSQNTTAVSFPALSAFKNTTAFKPGYATSTLYNTYFANAIAVIPETTHRFNSNYANATYTYDNKYNAFGSYRIDYADVFGLDEKFRGKPLWSAGVSWNLHNEQFLYAVNWVNFLKVRATYGITGNIAQGVSSFLTANSTLYNPITAQPLSVVTNAANPELRWEKTATTNLGTDFELFHSRLTGSFDWYRRKSTDLLVTQRLDPSEGFTDQIINNGSVLNTGIELSLQYQWFKPTRPDGFSWTSFAVLSKNKNRITHIDEVATTPIALAQGGYKTGHPVNSLYSFQYKGLDKTGQPQWLKADGTLTTIALTSNDLPAVVYSGSTDPQINATLNNEFRYKGFSLNVLAVYYGGQYLRALVPEVIGGVAYGSMPAYLADSWTPDHTNTIVPGFGQYAPGVYTGTKAPPPGHLTYSDAFVRPGDFIKIRSATLAYQLPQQLASRIASQGVRLHFQLNNPKAVWMRNNVGVDPETGGARIPTSFVFGLNVNY